ncbi:MAG: AAA family ATPase [Gammaproteobacteria bacterium]|nr:AAA family ATPase [Gammaproteobacteria bacterium]
MYLAFFKLQEFPFSLVSDPRFLYLSEDHARVKAYIEYAMQIQDSFLVCTGEIGTGKTTLVNDVLAQDHHHAIIARIQVNHLSSEEFLQQLLLEFGITPYNLQRVQVLDKLKQYLSQQFRAGKKVFLVVDEAHNISAEILEDIRYLFDLEHQSRKLLSVILIGQPELNTLIDKPEMEHIAQRIRLRCHIKPLNPNETMNYINHRLKVAGSRNISLFSEDCIPIIHQFTGGRIRLINTICDYALLHCCVEKISKVNGLIIQKAANELGWGAYEKRFGESQDVTRFVLPVIENGNSKIIVKHNEHVIDEINLSKDYLSFGRQSDNDVPIDDYKVSRYHAQIVTQGGISYLHDLNSTNGTFLNGQKISVHRLHNGENFTIGTYGFIFMQVSTPELNVVREQKDITRQMSLDNRDQTRVFYQHPYINLVNSETE